jgi:hypothetical protein
MSPRVAGAPHDRQIHVVFPGHRVAERHPVVLDELSPAHVAQLELRRIAHVNGHDDDHSATNTAAPKISTKGIR